MARSDKIIKEAGLEKWKHHPKEGCATNPTELLEFYPGAIAYNYASYNYIGRFYGCYVKGTSIFKSIANVYFYRWAGEGWLASSKLLLLEFLEELNRVKKTELEAAKTKRSNKVRTPTDAVRMIVKSEIGLSNGEYTMIGGRPRIQCGWFHLNIETNNDTADVNIVALYKEIQSYRTNMSGDQITTLNLADPQFNTKLGTIIWNFRNAKQILLGQVERRT